MVGYIFRIAGILAILTYFVNSAEACDYPKKLRAGHQLECNGVLLSDKQFIEASNNKRKLRLQDLKIAEYEGLGEIYEARHKHYVDELKTAKNELKWYEIKSNVGYVISFGVGAVITGFIAKEMLR